MAITRMMDDRFFNECIAHDECAKLRAVCEAVEKWENLAVDEWKSNRPDTSQMSDLQADWAVGRGHFNTKPNHA
jgi:hypothetical protein